MFSRRRRPSHRGPTRGMCRPTPSCCSPFRDTPDDTHIRAAVGGGILVDRLVVNRPMLQTRFVARDLSPVLEKLSLTADQRTRIDSILARRSPASESVMIELAAHLRAVSDSVDRELRAILTPGQRARLDS